MIGENFVEISAEVPMEVLDFANKHGLESKWFLVMSCG